MGPSALYSRSTAGPITDYSLRPLNLIPVFYHLSVAPHVERSKRVLSVNHLFRFYYDVGN